VSPASADPAAEPVAPPGAADPDGFAPERAHRDRDHEPADAQELIMHLERDQLVSETFRPVERARLSRPVTLSLWALRLFAVALSLMVLYTFIARL
jgi:hypothetical protein